MLRSYLTVALRNLYRQKAYAAINITGLAIGMAACILIMLWVQNELSYNRFHKNVDVLYRVEQSQKAGDRWFHVVVTAPAMGPALKEEIPEIVNATRLCAADMGEDVLLRSGDTSFYQSRIIAVDPSFLDMFTFPLLKGDAHRLLADPHSVVITRETAVKLFGDADPIGKVLTMNNRTDLTVSGVVETTPRNSDIRFTMLVPIELLRESILSLEWRVNEVLTFVQLRPGSSVLDVNEKITQLVYRHVLRNPGNPGSNGAPPKGTRDEFMLAPVKDMHLQSYFGFETGSDATQRIWIVSALALIILLIACINFMNLSTARAARRAREIGLRKIVGGLRRQIAGQFYGESILYAFAGTLCAVVLVEALLPAFNQMTGRQLSLSILGSGWVILALPLLVLFTGVVAGSYPALVLSAFQPVRILTRDPSRAGHGSFLRRLLVVVQFGLSILIMLGALAVVKQTRYMKSAPVGYEKEQVLCLRLPDGAAGSYDVFKTELLGSRQILGVASTAQSPTDICETTNSFAWEGKTPQDNDPVCLNAVDYDFVETMGIEIIDGRSFGEHRRADSGSALLINEEMAKYMRLTPVVGARLSYAGWGDQVIGVMKNFHFQPLSTRIQPLVLGLRRDYDRYALVRLDGHNVESAAEFVRSVWTRTFPQYPFTLRFLDQDFEEMYVREERLSAMLTHASVLAVLVACLGLYGLAAFVAEQKIKEIGVRKVLGASVAGIIRLLCGEFLLLVGIAFVLAIPVAWYGVTRWLEHFPYRMTYGWSAYFLAGMLAEAIAVITISYHAMKAAGANPVDSLKYE